MQLTSAIVISTRVTAAFCVMFILPATLSAQIQTPTSNSNKVAIPISDCATIDRSGSYVLTSNLMCPSANNQQTDGILITASSVTLHLAGHSIIAAGYAIHAVNVAKVVIVGPGTVAGISFGVSLENVTNSQLIGVTCDSAIVCIDSSGTSNRIVANKVSTYEIGIRGSGQRNVYLGNMCAGGGTVAAQFSGQGDLIKGNSCGGSDVFGFSIGGTNEIIIGNQADNNGKVGILVTGSGNQIRNNEATNNLIYDLQDDSTVCVGNTWRLNAFTTASSPCIN